VKKICSSREITEEIRAFIRLCGVKKLSGKKLEKTGHTGRRRIALASACQEIQYRSAKYCIFIMKPRHAEGFIESLCTSFVPQTWGSLEA
jgi:hypothetical protein